MDFLGAAPWPADFSQDGLEQYQSSIIKNWPLTHVQRAEYPGTWAEAALALSRGQVLDLPCLHSRGYSKQAKPRLHYQVWDRTEPGAEPPPAVLLVHGIMDWSYRWNVIGPVLAARFKTLVLAPDLPGRGHSAYGEDNQLLVEARPVTQGHSGDDYVRLLDEFIQRTVASDRQLWVAGHSMGGALAFLFSARFPERVEQLALMSPAGLMPSMAALRCCLKRDCIRGCVHKVMSGGQDKVAREDFVDCKTPGFSYLLAHMELQMKANPEHFLDPLLGCAMQFPLYGLEPQVEQFVAQGWKKPMLLMFGRHDKTVPFATMAGWARSLSSASGGAKPQWLTEYVVDDTAHCFFWEKPGESIEVLINFFARGASPMPP